MKNRSLSAVVVFLVLGIVPVSVRAQTDLTDEAMRAAADPMLDNILEAMKAQDYVKYCQDFDAKLKAAISQIKFLTSNAQIRARLGDCQSRTYLGFLKKSPAVIVLWKGKFSKSDNDMLIKLILTRQGDKWLVSGLWFQ
ncbi:MAG: hypothetical protein GXP25_08435 [Planctomycetes bacterium]|nr:hypothetical protein [Planctomycetota bacterium]